MLFLLAARTSQGLREIPFSRQAWVSDLPWGSRHGMARLLARNHALLGMTEADVKKYLGFGRFKSDYEAAGVIS